MNENNDERPIFYIMEIHPSIKPGDFLQIKYGGDILAEYVMSWDEDSIVYKYKLKPTNIIGIKNGN